MAWLDGWRVVDLTTGISGAYATKLLADAGAEVVLVEAPEGHPLRRWSASGTEGGEASPLFRYLSGGKGSVGDAGDPLGAADLVVDEGQVDPEALGPATTLLSMTPCGRTGPWAG